MRKKFELTDKYIVNSFGIKLFQIKCTRTFIYAKEGDLGGFIEKEKNLDQSGEAWVGGNAQVYGNAWVSENAKVYDNAQVYGNVWIHGEAKVYENAKIYGDAQVYGNAKVYGNAQIYGETHVYGETLVYGNADIENNSNHCGFDCFGSCNRHTHAYLTKEGKVEITCGCFRGSIEKFEKEMEKIHAGTIYEKQYKAIINVIRIKFGLE